MTSRSKPARSCGTARPYRRGCGAARTRVNDSLDAIVDDYLAIEARDHADEVVHYGTKRTSPRDAVRTAACSIEANGNQHSHQRRIGKARMRDVADRLAPHAETLTAYRDFDALHDRVESLAGGMERIGELAVYDVAERIGMYGGVEPRQVYLHSGTLKGAKELFPDLRGNRLAMSALPPPLRRLTAAQVENLLCIYKARLRALRQKGRVAAPV